MELVPGAKAREPEEDWENARGTTGRQAEAGERGEAEVLGTQDPGVIAFAPNVKSESLIKKAHPVLKPYARIAGPPWCGNEKSKNIFSGSKIIQKVGNNELSRTIR